MKIRILLSLIVLAMFSCAGSPQEQNTSPPKGTPMVSDVLQISEVEVYETPENARDLNSFLGEEILSLLQESSTVESYWLQETKDLESDNRLYEYPILQRGPDLTEIQRNDLLSILLNEDTYDFLRAKRGFLFPSYGFVFKGTLDVILLIDFSRNELMYIYEDKEYKEDFDSAREAIRVIIENLFPENNL